MMTMDLASVRKEAELRAFLLMVSEYAAWHPFYCTVKCLYCKRSVYFEELPEALLPGHIYSERGIDEFRISRCCEYCFDHMFMKTNEGEPGRCDVCREFDNLTMASDGMMLCTSCRIREENEADQHPPF